MITFKIVQIFILVGASMALGYRLGINKTVHIHFSKYEDDVRMDVDRPFKVTVDPDLNDKAIKEERTDG